MKKLSDTELDCLRRIAMGYSDVTSPCADNVLKHLLSLGLIEQRSNTWLPLEMMGVTYQVTTAGRDYLNKQ